MPTQLKDIVDVDYYGSLDPVNSPEKTNLVQSGIVTLSPMLNEFAVQSQGTAQALYWADLIGSAESNASTDDPAVKGVPDKIDQKYLKVRVSYNNKSFSVMDLVTELKHNAPMQRIRDRFGAFWTHEFQKKIVSCVVGLALADAAKEKDMFIPVTSIDVVALLNMLFTMGDSVGDLTSIGVHSSIMLELQKLNLIETHFPSDSTKPIYTYAGRHIFMDDSLKTAKGELLAVAFGAGAFGYGNGNPAVPVEIDRDAQAGNGGGQESLIERKTQIIAPAGYDWKGSEKPNESPRIADLALAKNWARSFERKNIPIAGVIFTPSTGGTGG